MIFFSSIENCLVMHHLLNDQICTMVISCHKLDDQVYGLWYWESRHLSSVPNVKVNVHLLFLVNDVFQVLKPIKIPVESCCFTVAIIRKCLAAPWVVKLPKLSLTGSSSGPSGVQIGFLMSYSQPEPKI